MGDMMGGYDMGYPYTDYTPSKKLTRWFKSNEMLSDEIKNMGYKLSEFGHLNDVKPLHSDITKIIVFVTDEYDGVS